MEKLTRSSLKGLSNRALFAHENGCFANRFLLLGIGPIGVLEASKKANLSFKSPSPKPHLNQTGPVFALPRSLSKSFMQSLRQGLGGSVCVPLCCKNLCCASRFLHERWGAGGSRSKNLLEGATKANASSGAQSQKYPQHCFRDENSAQRGSF